MGCTDSDSECLDRELPLRTIAIPAFKLSKFTVTFEQWDFCVADGGCSHIPSDEGWSREQRPVMNISYDDVAEQFIPWLNQKTGLTFRFPTEAEWEYAARAGTTARYGQFGDCLTTEQANYDGSYEISGCPQSKTDVVLEKTQPVGQYPANAFGLYDMQGNLFEWVEDCWNENYQDAPADSRAWMAGDCSSRGVRGGSWYDEQKFQSVWHRFRYGAAHRFDIVGMRLALNE